MSEVYRAPTAGLAALRCAVAAVLASEPLLSTAASTGGGAPSPSGSWGHDVDDVDDTRIAALVDLARQGDVDAFGALYDHYHAAVYRFVYYRVSTVALAEDLVSETFFRALRSMASFSWQGKDFGAWLMTIARNLVADHYKSGRNRFETATADFSAHEQVTESPEDEVLTGLTNDLLHSALTTLPTPQQECLVLRFISGCSIAETAAALGRSEGAVKQLQMRAIRNLAKAVPEELR